MDRKLAAIMIGDVVGSTSSMERNEDAAVAQISTCLDTVGQQAQELGGRVFNTAGDAVFVEFPSAVNALRAAMSSRSAVAQLPDNCVSHMRFGLHIADVIALGDDLRGDGVNLAARIQSAADPGAIDVSGTLYENVRRNSPCVFDEMGPQTFKGISEPVDVYRVRSATDRHRYDQVPTRRDPHSEMRPNSLAVLPIRLSNAEDEDQKFLANGLTDDLTLELSRLRNISVSSRSAANVLVNQDPVQVGKALGVRFVLNGLVRKLGNRVQLNVSLCETDKGEVVWSDRLQFDFEDAFDIMEQITARVAVTVSGRVENSALAAVRLKKPENMSAYEYYLRGVDLHRLGGATDANVIEALSWFEKAIEADPAFARPYAMWVCSRSYLPDLDLKDAEHRVAKALELDPTDPEAHRIMGIVRIKIDSDYEASRRHHEKALELAPTDAYVMGRCAAFYTVAGEPDRGLEMLDRAEELDPFLPVWVIEERVAAFYVLGRLEDVIASSDSLPYQTRRSRIYRAAALMALGQQDRARKQIASAMADDPSLSADYIRTQELFEDRTILRKLIDAACAAGLPKSG